ncbi:hypothetical protein [Kitasatospora sp. NPDC059803]|uniref:hypothetical protein n=1 Tax=Kitasatospora sp. NPDC059803 TaxID=3346953 RepID=UPI0036541605
MPPLGQVGGSFVEGSTPEQQELAKAMCALYGRLKPHPHSKDVPPGTPNPGTMAANAKRLTVSESALSGYLHARNVPVLGVLLRLHTAARGDAGGDLAWSWPQLKQLHERASRRPCERCREEQHRTCAHCGHHGQSCADGQIPVATALERQRIPEEAPADQAVQSRLAETKGGGGPVLPVPLPVGDRQNVAASTPFEAGLDEAIRHLRAGRDRDAHLVLAEAGAKLPVHRIPDVVMACQGKGLVVAADALLHSAARRPPEEVLHIVRLFNSAQYYQEADLVLRVATAG